MRLCLVFGLPLPRPGNTGEDGSSELVAMSWFCRRRGLTIWLVLLPLLWAAGCARPRGLPSDAHSGQPDQPQAPFQSAGAQPSSHHGAAPAAPPNPEARLPFHNAENQDGQNQDAQNRDAQNHDFQNHDAQNLPAGTLLTVRLKNPISAENPGASGTFEAVVDDPVVIEGNKLVPRGATVAGRVESARVSNVKHDLGYVRLALDSIRVADMNLPIQTASLFVRATASGNRTSAGAVSPGISSGDGPPGGVPAVIRLEKGRRLTFRLTETAYAPLSQRARTDH
jgi:hypothetical protein